MNRYNTGEDVSLRLNGTYVRHKGVPVYVTYREGTFVNVYPIKPKTGGLDEANSFSVDANSDALDISSIPVGFFEHSDCLFFAERAPVRRQQQGICRNNLIVSSIGGGPTPRGEASSLVSSDAFRKSLVMEKVKDASKAIVAYAKDSNKSVLILSQQYALVKTPGKKKLEMNLYMSENKIGHVLLFPDNAVRVALVHPYSDDTLVREEVMKELGLSLVN